MDECDKYDTISQAYISSTLQLWSISKNGLAMLNKNNIYIEDKELLGTSIQKFSTYYCSIVLKSRQVTDIGPK